MRVATSQQFLEAIIEVLSQFFDYLGLASRLEVQLSQPPSDFVFPVHRSNRTYRANRTYVHPSRSATIGSTFVARRAGTQQASKATPAKRAATMKNASGSNWLMSTNTLASSPDIAAPPPRPRATPIAISFDPCRKKSEITSLLCAPSASRIPISRVRRLTTNDTSAISAPSTEK